MADDALQFSIGCNICGVYANLKTCSKCKSVYYCGRDHQTQDWPKHKLFCKQKKRQTSNRTLNRLSNVQSQDSQRNTDHADRPQVDLTQKCSRTFDESPFKAQDFPKPKSLDTEVLPEFVATQLLERGYCVVDGLLTEVECEQLLGEVKLLKESEALTSGKLAGGRTSAEEEDKRVNSNIRSDVMTWIDHVKDEKSWPSICTLLRQKMDMTVVNASFFMGGKYTINGRSKAMVACYPGNGTSYQRHVDNPSQDGRIITCVLYLNKDWIVQKDGGLLRLFPTSQPGDYVDIEPVMNRMVFFWSDNRSPHEVQPTHRERFAITVWYFDEEERIQAKKDQEMKAKMDLLKVKEEMLTIETKTKELQKAAIEQRIENESAKAVGLLSEDELEAMAKLIGEHPDPKAMLTGMGVAPGIQKHLLNILHITNKS